MTFEEFNTLSQEERDYYLFCDSSLAAQNKFEELMDCNYNLCLDDFEILKSLIIEARQCASKIK